MFAGYDRFLWFTAAIWLILASAGLFAMADYGAEQGRSGDAPLNWPNSLQDMIVPDPARSTLVLFAHPLCPCTRATLWELERITNQLFDMVDLHILFFEPSDTSSMADIWAASDLKKIASRLPATQMHADIDGRIAKNFGAYTSGQVLLYSTEGALQFAGGITPSRGHMGANPGKAAVISSIVSDKGIDPLAARVNPVFGCTLHEDSDGDLKLRPESFADSELAGR